MDLASLVTGLAGLAAGFGFATLFGGGKRGDLLTDIATLNDQHDADMKETALLGDRCAELRIVNRLKDQANEKLVRRVAELEPDAELGRKHREQSKRALDAANAANRARHAAKLAGNVEPIRKLA